VVNIGMLCVLCTSGKSFITPTLQLLSEVAILSANPTHHATQTLENYTGCIENVWTKLRSVQK